MQAWHRLLPPPPVNTAVVGENTFENLVDPVMPVKIPLIQGETVKQSPCSNAGNVQGVDVGTSSTSSNQLQTTPSLEKTTTTDKEESCSFKRGGMCCIHNVVGTRSSKTSMSWKRKKDGTYGYMTSKKIEYTCSYSNKRKPVLSEGAGYRISGTDGVSSNGINKEFLRELSFSIEGDVTKLEESESNPPDLKLS